MFTCSICDETFVGVHQDSTHATLCGHVFHYHCLVKWLERSQTCPHCRSIVSREDLIKLFLQVDPNARVVWNKKIEEELYSLSNKLKVSQEKENFHTCTVVRLESQNNQLKKKDEQSNKTIQSLKSECYDYETKLNNLQEQLRARIVEITLLIDQKKNFETQLQIEKSKTESLEKNLYELQSVNSVVVDKLKSEIFDLKSEKEYFKSKYNILKGKNDNSSNTSELPIENKKNNLHQSHHVTRVHYGHDPNLIWSPTNFLCGCVFLIIVDHNNYEDICDNISMSKLNIIEHGGSVDLAYSPRITHIICTTQKNDLVQEGIKDGKRCITDYWLSDVIAKKNMLPPWLAHHFPTPYSKETGLPCQQYQIAIANFDANNYYLVKTMIELTGASVVNEVSSTTDVVVSLKLEGEMVETALSINKPVVNVQWLNDILFGAQIGIHNPTSMKYQEFDSVDPYSVNYEMVSHLMGAWKRPVIFLKDQEIYDLTVDDPTCPKRKRQKTKIENPELINLVDDDDDNDDLIVTYDSCNNSNNKKSPPLVMFCGFSIEEEEHLKQIILQLGGKVTNGFVGSHLVMKKPINSVIFLLSLSSVTYVVNEFWVLHSKSSSTFKYEPDYCISSIYDKTNAVVCNVPEILSIPTRQVLFKGKRFFVTPGIKYPSVINLQEMIRSAGGIVESQIRNTTFIQSLPPNSYYIISCEKDFHLIAELRLYNINVFSPDFIIHSIMQQKLMFEYEMSLSFMKDQQCSTSGVDNFLMSRET